MSNEQNRNSQNPNLLVQLSDLLGFDPVKQPHVTNSALNKVVQEIQDERQKKAEELAGKLLREAITLAESRHKLNVQYLKDCEKFDKGLKEYVKKIQRIVQQSSGGPVVEPEEDEQGKSTQTQSE